MSLILLPITYRSKDIVVFPETKKKTWKFAIDGKDIYCHYK